LTALTPQQRRAQGQAAEVQFRAWLDRCTLPHIFVEQSPLTLPASLKGEIKRPDFLVGIPTIGTIAVDVKAKSVYDDAIIIDTYEHRTLSNFETSRWRFGCPQASARLLNERLVRVLSARRATHLPSRSESDARQSADHAAQGRGRHLRTAHADPNRRRPAGFHGGADGCDQPEIRGLASVF
jgi:hypothetical protein